MKALSTSALGMIAQQTNVEVIANNIANVSTTGFKRHRASFQDTMPSQDARVGTNTSQDDTRKPSGIHIGAGVLTSGVYRIHDQGAPRQTGNTFDLMIEGKGYFRVQLPNNEEGYTRDGTFQLSEAGELVTSDGFRVMPGITVPEGATSISISKTGEVQAKLAGQVQMQVVGQLELSSFVNEVGLESIGGNLYRETEASGAPTSGTPGEENLGTVRQGYLEDSNVSIVTEMTELIKAQRSYDTNTKVMRTADEMMASVNNVR